MGGITCIVRFLLLSFLHDFVISDNPTIADKPRFSAIRHSYTNSIGGSQHNNKRRDTTSIGGSRHNGFENTRRYTSSLEGSQHEGFKKENGEFCESAEECVINDCRGSRCGGRAEGQWCEEDNWCSDKNCYKGACHKKDAYKNIGETCVHRRECLSTRCAEDKCIGRTNGEWCKMEEWCASNHCYKSRCTAKPVDPCTVPGVTAASCLGQCAWSNGECLYSESHVLCGGHQAPSCDLCPSGNGASWCDGDCHWSSESCILISDLSDPCVANDEVNTCTGDCAWSDGTCSFSESHVNCGVHQAPSCPQCPSGHGESWCDGECDWINGNCIESFTLYANGKFCPYSEEIYRGSDSPEQCKSECSSNPECKFYNTYENSNCDACLHFKSCTSLEDTTCNGKVTTYQKNKDLLPATVQVTFTVKRDAGYTNVITFTKESGSGPEEIVFGPNSKEVTVDITLGTSYVLKSVTVNGRTNVGELRLNGNQLQLEDVKGNNSWDDLVVTPSIGSFTSETRFTLPQDHSVTVTT